MTKAKWTMAASVVLLWAGTALAAPTAQEKCDHARITAWRVYTSCVEKLVAVDAKGVSIDLFTKLAKCRHKYFSKWAKYQKPAYAGSSCDGSRFTQNGDQTVTDNLSGLTWEKKDDANGIHDKDNTHTWSTGTNKEDGTVFTTFLDSVNAGGGFGGANGWRLPTLAELQTIVLDFPCTKASCTCPSNPCVDPALDAGNTQPHLYWSATSYVPIPGYAWDVVFVGGSVGMGDETTGLYVRAVRGGL